MTRKKLQPPADPYRLMRFVFRHALNGVMAGWAFLLALLWLDVGGLGARVHGAADGWIVVLMLAGAFGVTFSMVGIVWGVLVMLPDEPD
ncbi:hypothetical protein [Oceanicella actignis]|uniref:Uncharacterized protein n=1 Tax=Oceanicella actignis TaxID=1189325 RepID=A0A1M7U3G2_9RHOB|nr:hypothetical protein [Oceanicella actignis]TYO84629.1 hypothetical protein LY05_02926 [Oceanicella actignis]SET87081.1 hypothetical protein SAMN04488119_1145 [Oceanicella actignis]SHN77508.1 hypothetical protein SAMN05216200_1166 [Oceanicella actignis]